MEESKELIRVEEAQKIAEDLKEKYEIEKLAEMIKNNYILFTYKDKEYKIGLLDQKRKDELDLFRRRKFGELLQDKNILFENEMIKLYKEKGIDIEVEIKEKIKKINIELNENNFKLGEALEKKDPESILKTYRDEIKRIQNEIDGLVIQKSNLLENSFEKTLEGQTIKYLSYLSLEVKVEDKFVKAFDSIDEFLKTEDELIGKTITYAITINYRI